MHKYSAWKHREIALCKKQVADRRESTTLAKCIFLWKQNEEENKFVKWSLIRSLISIRYICLFVFFPIIFFH